MSPLTTHVLDIRLGRPAAGVTVRLERRDALGSWHSVAAGTTNDDGRIVDLLQPGELHAGRYRLTFETGDYFAAQKVESFYPEVAVDFQIAAAEQHYHVPLLLAPYGYSTYRGS